MRNSTSREERSLMNNTHEHFMGIALEQARAELRRGGRPVCALVVRDGKIIGQGLNTVSADNNPVSHAELNAIRNACAELDTTDFHAVSLPDSTLYTTMEPCPMCFATAILAARIDCVVLGARHARAGRKDLGAYSVESFLEFIRQTRVEIVAGVREAECEQLRQEWLKSLSADQLRVELLRSRAGPS